MWLNLSVLRRSDHRPDAVDVTKSQRRPGPGAGKLGVRKGAFQGKRRVLEHGSMPLAKW